MITNEKLNIALLKATDFLTDEEFDAVMYYEQWCKKNEYRPNRTILQQEAFEVFEGQLHDICISKMANNEDVLHFKRTLIKYKKYKNGEILDIEKAKKYPIDKLVSQLGYQPHFNRNIKCFLHEDKTASLKLYQNTNSYFCYGCHCGGDTINLLQKAKNINFVEAVKYLT